MRALPASLLLNGYHHGIAPLHRSQAHLYGSAPVQRCGGRLTSADAAQALNGLFQHIKLLHTAYASLPIFGPRLSVQGQTDALAEEPDYAVV